jgi:hypothetical protein
MALPSSGAISLNDVNVELGNSGNASINMGSTAVRDLFGVASGAISLSDGYGAASVSAVNPLTLSKTSQLCGVNYVPNYGPTGPYDAGPEFGREIAAGHDGTYYAVGARNTTPPSMYVFNADGSLRFNKTAGPSGAQSPLSVCITENYVVWVDRECSTTQRLYVYNLSNGAYVRTIISTINGSCNLGGGARVLSVPGTDIMYIRMGRQNQTGEVGYANIGTGAWLGMATTKSTGPIANGMAVTDNNVFTVGYDATQGYVEKWSHSLSLVATYAGLPRVPLRISATENTLLVQYGLTGEYSKIYSQSMSLIATLPVLGLNVADVHSDKVHHYVALNNASSVLVFDESGTLVRTIATALTASTTQIQVSADGMIIASRIQNQTTCGATGGTATGEAQIWKE